MSEPAAVTRGDVAKGAGLAGLARMGALIEALAQPLFVWLYGLATYGLYVAVWAAINFLANVVDVSTTIALQRLVPTAPDEERAHGIVKAAFLIAVSLAILVAFVATLNADAIAATFSAAPEDRPSLPHAIALFAWGLPLWTFVEVSTAAVRARRGFGPEIRLRILWEQIARILFALAFFGLGWVNLGLMVAHLCSLALTAGLCIPMLARFYDLRRLLRAPAAPVIANLFVSGLALLPSNVSRRALIDGPPFLLNLMLPGANGAAAAGLFEIARKISTVPHIIRQSFQYVLGPLTSAQAHVDRAAIAPLYGFATRVSTALVVPLAGLLAFAGADILSIYREEVRSALPLLYLLVAARAFEAIVGPATTIVEMIGHRLLPSVNSFLGVACWAILAFLLVPRMGATGMALAVGAGTILISYAATFELSLSDRLSPFDTRFARGLAVSLVGVGLMGGAEYLLDGPARFAAVLLLWVATTWCALRFGLLPADREALGPLSHRLRLLPPRA